MSEIVWDTEKDLAFLQASLGLKPVGFHRHLRMVNIYLRFLNRINSNDFPLKALWDRLQMWYNMSMLDDQALNNDDDDDDEGSVGSATRGGDDEQHRPLFTQDTADTDDINFWRKNIYEFSLPWQEFGEMMMERTGATLDEDQDDSTSVAAADAVSTISSVKVESPDADAESTFGEQQPATPAPSKKRKTKPGSGATATTTPAAKGRAKAPKSAQSLRKRTTKSRN